MGLSVDPHYCTVKIYPMFHASASFLIIYSVYWVDQVPWPVSIVRSSDVQTPDTAKVSEVRDASHTTWVPLRPSDLFAMASP